MSVLFINLPNPPGIHVNRDYCGGFGSAFRMKEKARRNVFPPIFDAYAAAVLENEGFEVRILDAQARSLSEAQVLQEVESANPRVVIGRISLPAFDNDVHVFAGIKKNLPNTVLVGWGSVCKVEPDKSLGKSELDVVVRDELEFTVSELVRKILNEDDLDAVEGISFKKQGKVVHNRVRPFQKDLDVLPFPASHLLSMDKYVARESYFFADGSKDRYLPFFTLLASRGGALNCL